MPLSLSLLTFSTLLFYGGFQFCHHVKSISSTNRCEEELPLLLLLLLLLVVGKRSSRMASVKKSPYKPWYKRPRLLRPENIHVLGWGRWNRSSVARMGPIIGRRPWFDRLVCTRTPLVTLRISVVGSTSSSLLQLFFHYPQ